MKSWFQVLKNSPASTDKVSDYSIDMLMRALNPTAYLFVDDDLQAISVFDELKYDRADADILSPNMRAHVVEMLRPLGFRQASGTVIAHPSGARVLIPKFHALGASPFDAIRYCNKNPEDLYLLTPTQTACRYIDTFPTETAVDRIEEMIKHQPINLLRIFDMLEHKPAHDAFREAIGYLTYVQRQAVKSEPLCRRRGLG